METCHLCPRECKVDRTAGNRGYCGETDHIRIARAALHMWEEPCISGINGSGAVFFSGCTLRCIFCQNAQIANGDIGREISVERLAEIFLELQEQKAENINLVTASHFIPQIKEAIAIARKKGLKIPFVYNSSGYEREKTIKELDGFIDIYLPDMKYYDKMLAMELSNAPDYFDIASQAIDEMVRQVGKTIFNQNGMMIRGVIIRHLVLPGHTKDSCRIVEYLYRTFGDKIYLSLMNQYTPLRKFETNPELNRKVTTREYNKVLDKALQLGVKNAFIQEGNTAENSFIPAFDYEGVEKTTIKR